jgi:hypothetical protein
MLLSVLVWRSKLFLCCKDGRASCPSSFFSHHSQFRFGSGPTININFDNSENRTKKEVKVNNPGVIGDNKEEFLVYEGQEV